LLLRPATNWVGGFRYENDSPANPLHAAPVVVGRIAQDAHVGRLVVSHLGLYDLNAALAELKTVYTGPLIVGADLQCTPIAR
jgi:ribonuclease BN (tRNA processing enzyme)